MTQCYLHCSSAILPMSIASILFDCGTKQLHDGIPSNCMMHRSDLPHTQAQKSTALCTLCALYTQCAHVCMCPYTNDIAWECLACSLSVMEWEFVYTLERIGCSFFCPSYLKRRPVVQCVFDSKDVFVWWLTRFGKSVCYKVLPLLFDDWQETQQRQQPCFYCITARFSYGWPSCSSCVSVGPMHC